MPRPAAHAFRRLRASDAQGAASGSHAGLVGRIRRYVFEERRFREYGRLIGRALGLAPDQVEIIARALPYRDLGKLSIPARILFKADPLDATEVEELRRHTYYGAWTIDRLNDVEFEHVTVLWTAKIVALTHHERYDGGGYPMGRAGGAIPLPGRIAMLADVYDALRSRRPYKPAYDHERARHILLHGDDRTRPEHFDPQVLQVFREHDDRFAAIFDAHAEEAPRG